MTIRGIECCFIGVLSRDPSELKQGKNGKPYCNFPCSIPCDAAEPQWCNVITFGETAEAISKDARKGDKVFVSGTLTIANWTNADGEARSGLAVSAAKVQRLGLNRDRIEKAWISPEDIPLQRKPKHRPPRTFSLFRKKAPPTETDPAKEQQGKHARPFDDKIPF